MINEIIIIFLSTCVTLHKTSSSNTSSNKKLDRSTETTQTLCFTEGFFVSKIKESQ